MLSWQNALNLNPHWRNNEQGNHMAIYILKRLFQSCITVLIIVTLVFLMLRMLPTDYYFTENELTKLNEEQKHDILEAQGLLDPPLIQLGRFYKDLLQGDLGTSRRIKSGQPVTKLIGKKLVISMKMGLVALGISLFVGVISGVFQALRKGRLFDKIGTAYTIFANAVPKLVSYSLILVLGARVFNLPSMFTYRNVVRSSILPVICLSLGTIASYMIWTRRYMVDELSKDYVRLAKIKGLSDRAIVFKHVLKNAFVPLVQFIPGAFLYTMGGSLLVERFFSVPGMGTLLTDAINRYDTSVVQIVIMFYAVLGVLGVLLGDLIMIMIDPRIRLTNDKGAR